MDTARGQATILVVDDDRDVLETARMFLKQEFSLVQIEEDPTKIPALMKNQDFDVILLDMNFKKGVNDRHLVPRYKST